MKLTSKDKTFNSHHSLPCSSLNVNSDNLAVHQVHLFIIFCLLDNALIL